MSQKSENKDINEITERLTRTPIKKINFNKLNLKEYSF